MCVELYGEELGIKRFRKFFGWYSRGFHSIRPLRSAAFQCATREELAEIISQLAGKCMDAGCVARSAEDFAGLS